MSTGIVLLLIFVYLLVFAVGIASYVLTSLGIFRISKQRGVGTPWMAWIPVANSWLIGKICEEYDGQRGYKRPWHKVLLIMNLITVGGMFVFYVLLFVAMGIATYSMSYTYEVSVISMILLVVAYIGIIVVAVIAVASSACTSICIYKIFESFVPQKAIKYLLLYLLVPIAGGICLLKCKETIDPYAMSSMITYMNDPGEGFEAQQ